MNVSPFPSEVAALADQAEALAFADFFAAAPEALKIIPTAILNRAIGFGMHSKANVADIDLIVERYRQARSPAWCLHWNPFACPEDLPLNLAAKGFAYPGSSSWAKMWRGPETPPHIASALAVAQASHDQAHDVGRIFADAFGMPPFIAEWLVRLWGRSGWKMYAVTDGSEVVGGGCLFLSGESAWLGMGAIAATHRRRGGQGALMARRVEDAIAARATHIFTETGEPAIEGSNSSLNNMKRCGFAKIVSRLNVAGPSSAGIGTNSR
jgi:hypothetical protein